MTGGFSSRFTVTPVWSIIREIRQKVRDALASERPNLVEPAAMVASELMENAIKYGLGEIEFAFQFDADQLSIVVTNEVGHEDDAESVFRTLEVLRGGDALSLYTERLTQLMDGSPTRRCQLGLLRIEFEGGFAIKAEREGSAIVVTATRSVEEGTASG